MTNNLNAGDVVVIEWKDVSPHIKSMKKYHRQQGKIVDEIDAGGDYYVEMEDGKHFYWNHTSLTKIGEL